MYSISKNVFLSLAREIAELANKINKLPYTAENVEICFVLMDPEHEEDCCIISRAMVRNPNELIYDFLVDVVGPPEEAFLELKSQLEEKIWGKKLNNQNKNQLN